MKRLVGVLLVACLLPLVTVAAQGRLSSLANGTDGYHHLLMLDQREALEHLKALHHYVQEDAAPDPAVVAMHVDELERNLNGMKVEMARVEAAASAETSVSPTLADLRHSQERAATLFANLKELADRPTAKPAQLRAVSYETYQHVRNATMLHGRVMSKLGVREPLPPSR